MNRKALKERGTVAGALLVVIVLAISTSGCTSPSPSPSPSPSQHDALLEGLVAADYNRTLARATTVTLWNVTWTNNTMVNVQFDAQNQTQGATVNGNRTFIRFNSTDAATSFVNSINLVEYTLNGSVPASAPGLLNFTLGALYENVTGHPPAQYRMYIKTSQGQNTLNLSAVAQADDVVSLVNATARGPGGVTTPSPTPSVSPSTAVVTVTVTASPSPGTTSVVTRTTM